MLEGLASAPLFALCMGCSDRGGESMSFAKVAEAGGPARALTLTVSGEAWVK